MPLNQYMASTISISPNFWVFWAGFGWSVSCDALLLERCKFIGLWVLCQRQKEEAQPTLTHLRGFADTMQTLEKIFPQGRSTI